MRAGYRVLLELDERNEVVGEAASGRDAVAVAADTQPDVVLLDLALPDLEQSEETAGIVSHPALADAAVLLMTPSEGDERIFSGLGAGAAGVLAKNADPSELRRTVQVLACGAAVLPPAALRRLIGELPPQYSDRRALAHQLEELTEREREVVALVGKGLTNGEIATHLVISPATAKTHVYRAMTKLDARHRAELAVTAYETGLVVPRSGSRRSGRRLLALA